MSMEEEEFTPYGAFSSGCDIHGEDFLRECTMCGIEFCSACFPQSTLCSDCAAQGDLADEDEPTEEEKELKLLEGFNDDEHDPEAEEKAPALTAPSAKIKAAAPKAPKTANAVAKKTKAPPKAKAKAKAKVKAKKPAKSASKKRKR